MEVDTRLGFRSVLVFVLNSSLFAFLSGAFAWLLLYFQYQVERWMEPDVVHLDGPLFIDGAIPCIFLEFIFDIASFIRFRKTVRYVLHKEDSFRSIRLGLDSGGNLFIHVCICSDKRSFEFAKFDFAELEATIT